MCAILVDSNSTPSSGCIQAVRMRIDRCRVQCKEMRDNLNRLRERCRRAIGPAKKKLNTEDAFNRGKALVVRNVSPKGAASRKVLFMSRHRDSVSRTTQKGCQNGWTLWRIAWTYYKPRRKSKWSGNQMGLKRSGKCEWSKSDTKQSQQRYRRHIRCLFVKHFCAYGWLLLFGVLKRSTILRTASLENVRQHIQPIEFIETSYT